jgi:hypothetical protein
MEQSIKNRDKILKLLEPLFPDYGAAGVYISKKLNAEMGVAGNEISISFYNSRENKGRKVLRRKR